LQNPALEFTSKTTGHSTSPYAWAVEQVALSRGLPLLRTAAVLARTPGDKTLLFADNMHLSVLGDDALAQALGDLFK
jgi:hypothetical protein